MTNGQDNRRSFRVNESVYLKHDLLTDQEFHEGLEHRKLKLGINDGAQAMLVDLDARLSEVMYRLSAENEFAGKCITLLNDKVNLLLDQMPGTRETKSSLIKQQPQTCDVGADGMVFAASAPLEIGTKLHLQFLLSTDNRYVETFAHVVRQTDSPSADPELPHGIAVEFHGMKPAQREILIQHMFNLESETLRMRRLQLDAMES
jgi:hypothetical protein